MSLQDDPQLRFHAEASVAVAKAASLFASAQAGISGRDLVAAGVSTYYGVFHLGLSLMWLLPDSLPVDLHSKLSSPRVRGDGLPNRLITHTRMEQYLSAELPQYCRGITVPGLGSLFKRLLSERW